MSNVRPYFESSIEELETECAGDTHLIDRETRRQVQEELSFRRGSKRVRALAKQLGCQWKVSPSNAGQVAPLPPYQRPTNLDGRPLTEGLGVFADPSSSVEVL